MKLFLSDLLTKKIVQYSILFFLVLFFLFRVVQTLQKYKETKGLDFRTVYLGAKLLSENKNPYNDVALKNKWQEVLKDENITDHIGLEPGLPDVPLLYQPYTLTLFVPLSWMPYKIALPVWQFICTLSLLGLTIGFIYSTHLNNIQKITVFVFATASTIIFPLILVGQPTAFFIATGFTSIYFLEKNRALPSTVFLFLTIFKSTLAVPFVFYFILKKQWKILLYSSVLIGLVHLLLLVCGFDLLQLYLDNLKLVNIYRSVHFEPQSDYKAQLYSISFSTELLIIPQFYFQKFYLVAPLIMIPAFLIIVFLLYKKFNGKTISEVRMFLILAVLSLLCFHHLFYDQILMLPIILFVPFLLNKNSWTLFIFLFVIFFPVQGIFQRLDHYSVLWLHRPVVLLILLFWIVKSDQERNHFFTP